MHINTHRIERSSQVGVKITIKVASLQVYAELNDTEPATKIADTLPFEGEVRTWGDEIYFTIPVSAGEENPKEIVDMGDIGYWQPGKAMCIFFGPTPASQGDEIRPASPVSIVGRVSGDPKVFKGVSDGEKIEVALAD